MSGLQLPALTHRHPLSTLSLAGKQAMGGHLHHLLYVTHSFNKQPLSPLL